MRRTVLNAKNVSVLGSDLMTKQAKKQPAPAVSKEFSAMVSGLIKSNKKLIRELSKY